MTTWVDYYGVLGLVSFKDTELACEQVTEDAKEQVQKELRAPRFIVLGAPSSAAETVPPSLTESKIAWVAFFEDRESYHDGEHTSRTTSNGFLAKLGEVNR